MMGRTRRELADFIRRPRHRNQPNERLVDAEIDDGIRAAIDDELPSVRV